MLKAWLHNLRKMSNNVVQYNEAKILDLILALFWQMHWSLRRCMCSSTHVKHFFFFCLFGFFLLKTNKWILHAHKWSSTGCRVLEKQRFLDSWGRRYAVHGPLGFFFPPLGKVGSNQIWWSSNGVQIAVLGKCVLCHCLQLQQAQVESHHLQKLSLHYI